MAGARGASKATVGRKGHASARSCEIQPCAAEAPIIALGANVLARQIGKYRACGRNDPIAKPIAVGELPSKVAPWSDAAAGARTPQGA
ncbi:hypothetical protein ASD38_17955 [Caulobacter sp. Root487D2Y]|nr:hypothetical protein ASD38_17955 [Caulobacter sp. Root487D2Y]